MSQQELLLILSDVLLRTDQSSDLLITITRTLKRQSEQLQTLTDTVLEEFIVQQRHTRRILSQSRQAMKRLEQIECAVTDLKNSFPNAGGEMHRPRR
jgi:hypothetical protein